MNSTAVFMGILQGEKNHCLGCALPCISKIKQEIQTIPTPKMQPK